MLKNIRLGIKIGGGFIFILIITIIIAIVSWNGMNGIIDRVEKGDDVNRLVKYMLQTRHQEKNFIIRKDKKYINNINSNIAKIRTQANKTKNKFNQDINKTQMDYVLKEVANYEKAFFNYVSLEDKKEIIEQRMLTSARDLDILAHQIREDQKNELINIVKTNNIDTIQIADKIVKADDANRIIKWILEVRKSEKNYIIRKDIKEKDKVFEIVNEIVTLAHDMKIRFKQVDNQRQVKSIIIAAQNYKTAFHEYIAALVTQDKANEEMVAAARLANEMCTEARLNQKIKMEKQILQANIIIIGGSIAAILFGILITIVITHTITKVIKKGVNYAKAVAQGNLSANIDINQKDEIGIFIDALREMVTKLSENLSNVKNSYQIKLKALSAELTLAEEQERRRISSELHDHLGQKLSMTKIKLGNIQKLILDKNLSEELQVIRNLIKKSIQEVRSLIFKLSSPVLYELGLIPALEWLLKQFGKQYGFICEFKSNIKAVLFSENYNILLYKIINELLVNVVKHANAQNIKILIQKDREKIQIQVEDDGIGFNISEIESKIYNNGGFGLFSIRERLSYIGGKLIIESKLKQGTKVFVTIFI